MKNYLLVIVVIVVVIVLMMWKKKSSTTTTTAGKKTGSGSGVTTLVNKVPEYLVPTTPSIVPPIMVVTPRRANTITQTNVFTQTSPVVSAG